MNKAVMITISIILFALMIAGGTWYVMNLRKELLENEADIKTLSRALTEQKQTIDQLTKDQVAIRKAGSEVAARVQQQDKEVKALTKKFTTSANNKPRDLGKLAEAKPGLIEKAINNGTKNAMRCLEIASGAALTEVEINAKTITEINKECPSMANPSYTAAGN